MRRSALGTPFGVPQGRATQPPQIAAGEAARHLNLRAEPFRSRSWAGPDVFVFPLTPAG